MSLSPVVITPAPSASTTARDGSEQSRASALEALAPWFDSMQAFASLEMDAFQAFVRDLAFATASLAAAERARAVVPTEPHRTAWEVGLERDGDELLVSLYRCGSPPEVRQTGRPIGLTQAGKSLLAAARALTPLDTPPGGSAGTDDQDLPGDRGLVLARRQLALAMQAPAHRTPLHRSSVRIDSRGRAPLSITAAIEMRRNRGEVDRSSELARSDLHALLLLGDVELRLHESAIRLHRVHVFLLAEQLLQLSAAALGAAKSQRALLRRVRAGNVTVGVRGDETTGIVLLLSEENGAARRLPSVSPHELARAACSFCADLAKAVVAADWSQSSNLRLSALRTAVRGLRARIRPAAARRSVVNTAPESYRAFAESDHGRSRHGTGSHRGVGKLRFTESWRAAVGGIDLRSIILAGDRLLVGSRFEIACLERSLGLLLWRKPAERGVSILTPRGLARLTPDGGLELYDLDDGEVTLRLQLDPCVGAATSGAVVNAPTLPPMLLVAEGSQHLAAVDLESGEIRWRRSIPRRGHMRLRRAGKLMVVAAGTTELQALDLLTGEIVWRRCGSLAYSSAPAIDGGCLLALASEPGGGRGRAVLERIDSWSGAVMWSRTLPRPVLPAGPPRFGGEAALIITDDDGSMGLTALERDTGEVRFDLEGGLVAGSAACLVVDDTVVASGAAGQLVGVDAADGHLRYRHVFASSRGRDPVADRPQSYQPVLRSGALFVPQSEIFVVRPRDGTVLGRIPCDLVPDLLRVDERCGVYVAEASGHLTAYAAQPTLRLVTTVTAQPSATPPAELHPSR